MDPLTPSARTVCGDLKPERVTGVEVSVRKEVDDLISGKFHYSVSVLLERPGYEPITLRRSIPDNGPSLLAVLPSLSPYLYEKDPRIGLRGEKWIGKKFPRCPLFDPPGYDPGAFFALGGTCPLCSKTVSPESLGGARWGGGNLRWVHTLCAPWLRTP